MKIFINSSDYEKLINICKNSSDEQNGLIRLFINDGVVSFLDFTESKDYEILQRTSHHIVYDSSVWDKYQMLRTLFYDPNKEIWVDYHTHPCIYSCNELSDADIRHFKYKISIRNKVYREEFNIEPPIHIEAVITEDEVGFFSIDDDRIFKHQVIVDGREIKMLPDGYIRVLKRRINRLKR